MADYLVYNDKYVPRAFGLNNTGAICWFNSLLQSLLSLPALTQYMLANETRLSENRMAAEYIRVLKVLFDVTDGVSSGSITVPANMTAMASTMILNGLVAEIRAQKKKNKKAPCGQEGVQDYFNDFLELLNDDGITRLFNNRYNYLAKCTHCGDINTTRRPGERDLFIEVDCNLEFTSRSEFSDWIRNHATETESYKCEKCNQVSKNIPRVQQLCMLREVVTVFFKWIRRAPKFWYPQTLQFPCKDGGVLTYRIVAQIEHVGSYNSSSHTSGGHYYAKCMRDRFYELNDNGVNLTDLNVTPKSQIVFYHLIPRDTALTEDEQAPK